MCRKYLLKVSDRGEIPLVIKYVKTIRQRVASAFMSDCPLLIELVFACDGFSY